MTDTNDPRKMCHLGAEVICVAGMCVLCVLFNAFDVLCLSFRAFCLLCVLFRVVVNSVLAGLCFVCYVIY